MDKIDVCKNCECSETAHPYGDLYCSLHNKTCDFICECNNNPYMNGKQEENKQKEDKTIKDKIYACEIIINLNGDAPCYDMIDHERCPFYDTCDCGGKNACLAFAVKYIADHEKQENKPVNMTATEAGFPEHEPVKNPSLYTSQVPGIECIDVAQHFNFNRGNIIEYAWRCGDKGDAIQDLEKVIQYAKFEIERLKNV